MARYEHLHLVRLPEQLARRKKPGFGASPPRDVGEHSAKLRRQVDDVVDEQRKLRSSKAIDPSLILRVQMSGGLMETDWEQLGLVVLASDEDKTLVLFASNDDLHSFRERLDAYARGVPAGQKAASHAGFIGNVESIGSVGASDRIGLRLREEGFANPTDFQLDRDFVLDIELWDIGSRDVRTRVLDQLANLVEEGGGEVYDRYIGPSITLLLARLTGSTIREILEVGAVSVVDLPPVPDSVAGELIALEIDDLPELSITDENAPVIGVIDSGVNAHPALEGVLVGAIGVPASLGTADVWGHGTRVAGVAALGDLREQLASGALLRGARIASAKVLSDSGRFEETRLVPSQMREALVTLNQRFGCRIFVISLADGSRVYSGGKVGAWAATLDELARELNVLIVVAAGNRAPRSGPDLEQAVTEYPAYLAENANRLFEPAGAVNVVTVGSLAHGHGLSPASANDAHLRSITGELEPSPFTRIGPGVSGGCKPDLVDLGGTMVFDAVTASLRSGVDLPTAGMLTLHNRFLDRLFTAGSGTSYAAPLVAHKAAQILTLFPSASANLIRALLVGAAQVPTESLAKLAPLGRSAVRNICGHGQVDTNRAAYSDDHRVVLFAEDLLAYDHFAVYELPIPEPFQGGGRRTIRVTLAFDPPVRHSRADYAGVGMSYRLVRGCDSAFVFDHYRKRAKSEGKVPELGKRYDCKLEPGPQTRELGTVQSSSVTFSRSTESYGDKYFLVVRCEGGWATTTSEAAQRFAVVVELLHQEQVQLYARLTARVRVKS